MIRSKPSTAEYRDAWERNFGEQAKELLQTGMVAPGDEGYEAVVEAAIPDEKRKPHRDLMAQAIRDARARTSHESDCPSRIGDPCRCPVGNL